MTECDKVITPDSGAASPLSNERGPLLGMLDAYANTTVPYGSEVVRVTAPGVVAYPVRRPLVTVIGAASLKP